MRRNSSTRQVLSTTVTVLGTAFASILFSTSVSAESNWNMHFAWPPSNFNVRQAEVFAEEVKKVTGGEVVITVHPSGSLGIKGPETLASVRDGIVPIAGMSITQNAGDEPFLLLYSVPYLATNFGESAKMAEAARPALDEIFAKHNQKPLYYVLWPAQIVYSKDPMRSLEDLDNFTLRTADKGGTTFFDALGASPIQMPWGEVVPALATGAIDGVTTSSTSGIDGHFWEFLSYVNLIKWNQSPEAITVNLDAWNALEKEHQDAIEKLARELEPKFQEEVFQEDANNLEMMKQNGMTIIEPDENFQNQLTDKARPFWDAYVERVGGPDSLGGKVVAKYRSLTGK